MSIPSSQIHIKEVIFEGKLYEYKYSFSTPIGLQNFDLPVGDDTFLVLDNYGNEHMSYKFHKRLFNVEDVSKYTIGINRRTGVIHTFYYCDDGSLLVEYFGDRMLTRIPEQYLSRIDDLKSCKRPFYVTIYDNGHRDFIDGEIGYKELSNYLVIDFDFSPNRLQLWGSCWREISDWEEIKNDIPVEMTFNHDRSEP